MFSVSAAETKVSAQNISSYIANQVSDEHEPIQLYRCRWWKNFTTSIWVNKAYKFCQSNSFTLEFQKNASHWILYGILNYRKNCVASNEYGKNSIIWEISCLLYVDIRCPWTFPNFSSCGFQRKYKISLILLLITLEFE